MVKFAPEGALIGTAENEACLKSLAEIEKAMKEGRILEARALWCEADLTLRFRLGDLEGYLPKEEVCVLEEGAEVRDIAVICRVGKPCVFRIKEIVYQPEIKIILSRKSAQERCLEEYLDLLEDGDIIPAKVTHFEPFGAFCDIGCGIPSLMSIDCISISRISHPSDRFFLGEEILCAVKCRVERKLGRRGRIALTHKELLGTWEENAEHFQAGQTVMGVVRSIESYGIFVELAPNLAGLAEWRDGVNVGDGCSVYIKSIIPEKKKIKLVLISTFQTTMRLTPTKYFITEGNLLSFLEKRK